MKLRKLTVQNFRCYRDPVELNIDDITVLIGKNDAGKSTLLDALGVFFDKIKIDQDDACNSGDRNNVRITCTFDDLPPSLVIDRTYETTLANEYMLNSAGQLQICKVFDCGSKATKLKGTFAIAHHPSAANYSDLLRLVIADLKDRASKLGVDLHGVDTHKKAEIRRALYNACPDLALSPTEIPLEAETAKDLWDQLRKELPLFALFKSDRKSTDQDEEAQEPMKTAIEEAIAAREVDLQRISDFVKQEVESIAAATVEQLAKIDPGLAKQLRPRFGTLNWNKVFSLSLTDEGDIPINKRGSGVRRLILLSFFRARAEREAAKEGERGVIYAVEELETSQHPDNQKLLLDAFNELATGGNCQVIVTSHSPNLVKKLPAHTLRYIEVGADGRRRICSGEATFLLVRKALGMFSDHDVKLFIGVEGKHDESFLKIISKTLHAAGESVPDLDVLADAGTVIFFPLGGQNLDLWSSRLSKLNRPEFHLYDRDEEPKTAQHQESADQVNQRSECKAVITGKREVENYIHPEAIKDADPTLPLLAYGDMDDVPRLLAKELQDRSASPVAWDSLKLKKQKLWDGKAKTFLNNEAVRYISPARLTATDPAGDLRSWLHWMQERLV